MHEDTHPGITHTHTHTTHVHFSTATQKHARLQHHVHAVTLYLRQQRICIDYAAWQWASGACLRWRAGLTAQQHGLCSHSWVTAAVKRVSSCAFKVSTAPKLLLCIQPCSASSGLTHDPPPNATWGGVNCLLHRKALVRQAVGIALAQLDPSTAAPAGCMCWCRFDSWAVHIAVCGDGLEVISP